MREVTTCRNCGDVYMHIGFGLNTHRCQPVYRVWCPDDGEAEADARKIAAHSPDAAAERWAEEEDPESDYCILDGCLTVHVRGPDGVLTAWVVSGESVPTYTAREAEADALSAGEE